MEEKDKVLENDPYIIYGSPLLLKPMPKYFSFGKEEISSFPIWVQLRNVPFMLWNPMVFGKICSKIGRPIHMDRMTTQKERVTYARCLVEVDMAKDITHSVLLQIPDGEDYEQRIYYENLPRYCPHYKVVGHTKESCKGKTTTAIKVASKPTEVSDEATTSEAGGGKKGHQEWILKQTKSTKGNPGDKVANIGHKPTNMLESIPETPENVATPPLPKSATSFRAHPCPPIHSVGGAPCNPKAIGRGHLYPASNPFCQQRD